MKFLRRVKCLFVNHVHDTWTEQKWALPGQRHCARCGQFYAARDPLGLEHAAILRRNGWTDDEIMMLRFTSVPTSEVLRFLGDVRRVADERGAEQVQSYEDGYLAGYHAAALHQ